MPINFVCPLIVVRDVEKSKKFYTELLGQNISMDAGENVTFQNGFSIHQRDHFAILLDTDPSSFPTPASWDNELYFEADDIDNLYEMLKEENVGFLHGIREQPWLQRVMRFFDPDGHIIEIGETMERVVERLNSQGLSIEEIEEKTSIPLDFIRDLLEEDAQ